MNNELEIWKSIKNYETLYEVSDLGNVRSLDRVIETIRRIGGKTVKINTKYKGKQLKLSLCDTGYLKVVLANNGTHISYSVHKLVAIAFLNHTPCKFKIVVDHIDEDKINNIVNNLQLLTSKENTIKSKNKLK